MTELEDVQELIQRAQADSAFCQDLVQELVSYKTENAALKEQLAQNEATHKAAQLALRQARGVSSYLRNNKHQLNADDVKAKEAMKKAIEMSHFLETKTQELELKLENAYGMESKAQMALRQARGVTSYLKSKNESLEKKLAQAAKAEQDAKKAWRQARDNSMLLRRQSMTLSENPSGAAAGIGNEEEAKAADMEEIIAQEEHEEALRELVKVKEAVAQASSSSASASASPLVPQPEENDETITNSETIGMVCLAMIAVSMIF